MFKYVFLAIVGAISYVLFFHDAVISNALVGKLFVGSILSCLVVFLLFKFGVHYKIQALNKFAIAFYYSVFEYKKAQKTHSGLVGQ